MTISDIGRYLTGETIFTAVIVIIIVATIVGAFITSVGGSGGGGGHIVRNATSRFPTPNHSRPAPPTASQHKGVSQRRSMPVGYANYRKNIQGAKKNSSGGVDW